MTAKPERNEKKSRQQSASANVSASDKANATSNGDVIVPSSGKVPGRNGGVRIPAVEILGGDLRPTRRTTPGSRTTLRAHVFYDEVVKSSRLKVTLRDSDGREAYSAKVVLEDPGSQYGGMGMEVDFTFDTPLPPDTYQVTAFITPADDHDACLDSTDSVMPLEVLPNTEGNGAPLPDQPPRIEVRLKGRGNRTGVEASIRSSASD